MSLKNKAVLISIRPEWCDLIVRGKKTIEVRKTRPKLRSRCTSTAQKPRSTSSPFSRMAKKRWTAKSTTGNLSS